MGINAFVTLSALNPGLIIILYLFVYIATNTTEWLGKERVLGKGRDKVQGQETQEKAAWEGKLDQAVF